MQIAIAIIPIVLTSVFLLGIWVLFRSEKQIQKHNASILKGVVASIDRTREISDKTREIIRKIDDFSEQVTASQNHQRKIFDHHRAILGSLNSQLVKLDVMLSGFKTKQDDPEEIATARTTVLSNGAQVNAVKLNCENLPKTGKGMELLETIFMRRGMPAISVSEEVEPESTPVMFRRKVHSDSSLSQDDSDVEVIPTPLAARIQSDAQAPRQQEGAKSILKLFSEQSSFGEQEHERLKRSA